MSSDKLQSSEGQPPPASVLCCRARVAAERIQAPVNTTSGSSPAAIRSSCSRTALAAGLLSGSVWRQASMISDTSCEHSSGTLCADHTQERHRVLWAVRIVGSEECVQ